MSFASRLLCAGSAIVVAAAGSTAAFAENIDVLLIDGKFTFDARVRYEHVDQDGFANEANAPTARARFGFVTGKFANFQGLIEGEAVGHLSERFNDTVNDQTAYPQVVDPEGVELNRLQIDYTGIPQTLVRVGRQRVNLDNQRFVGAVGWRQNEQTFDAALISNTSIDGLTLTYAFVNQVNRINGKDHPQGEIEGSSHLFNAAYDWAPVGKVVGYGYLIDAHDPTALAPLSTATFGLRVSGKKDVGDGYSLGYEAEYAHQDDYADNPNNLSLNYWHGDLWVVRSGFTVLAGVESLEGDGAFGFSAPLGTLHKFQGYADAFLTTPANGIVDIYGKVGYETKFAEPVGPITGLSAAVWYHDFDAESGGQALGEEFDFEAVARLGEHYAIGTKYADYDGDGGVAGREKVWVYIEANY